MAVLSACETGLGELRAGEGVYGLRRAFQVAGARTVVSALWPVADNYEADILSGLYDRRGQTLPMSLRQSQLAVIENLRSRGRPDHPVTWAAFVAVGDWR